MNSLLSKTSAQFLDFTKHYTKFVVSKLKMNDIKSFENWSIGFNEDGEILVNVSIILENDENWKVSFIDDAFEDMHQVN